MSHHYNALTDLKSNLQQVMMSCWKEGRKLTTDNPSKAEVYFVVGETCMELIRKIQDEMEEEVKLWHQ